MSQYLSVCQVCCTRATGDRLVQVSTLCHITCQSVRCVVRVLKVIGSVR